MEKTRYKNKRAHSVPVTRLGDSDPNRQIKFTVASDKEGRAVTLTQLEKVNEWAQPLIKS